MMFTLSKKVLKGTVLFGILVFSVLSVVLGIEVLYSKRQRMNTEMEIIGNNELQNIALQNIILSVQLEFILEDLLYLYNQSTLQRAVDSLPDRRFETLQSVWISFLKRKGKYDQVRILDTDGMEMVRVNYNNGEPEAVPAEELQDKSDYYYFSEEYDLSKDEIIISHLDLNVENGEIEIPYKPVIRLSLPIFNSEGEKKGYLILNYLADHLLLRIKEMSKHSIGSLMLVDSKGQIIYKSDQSGSQGFILNPGEVIHMENSFPDFWTEIGGRETGQLMSEKGMFTFQSINIFQQVLKSPSFMYPDTQITYSTGKYDAYHWKLVSFVPQAVIRDRLKHFNKNMTVLLISFMTMITLLSVLYSLSRARRLTYQHKLKEEARIFNSNPYPVIKTDGNGKIVQCNKSADNLIGYSLLNKNLSEIIPVFDAENAFAGEKGSTVQFEQTFGETSYLISVIEDVEGDGLFLYGTDISNLKSTQRDLHRLSVAVEQSANTIAITDIDGNLQFVNNAFLKATGYSREEVLGENPRILKSDNLSKSVYKELWQTITSGNVWRGEFHNRRKDGTTFWEQALITPIRNEKGEITNFLSVKEDITKRKETEEALTKAMKDAEEANRLKSEFLANMSHEIRTPMNAITGFTEILLEEITEPDQIKKLEIIKRSGKTLLNLINDILDFSKIEAGKIEIAKEDFVFCNVIDHMESLVRKMPNYDTLKYSAHVEDSFPAVVFGDEHRLSQILLNLLNNAFKFTSEGSVSVTCRYKEGNGIITITDTGIGIGPEKIEHIFSPFEQEDSSTERRFGGSGLGLAISKKLAELMGGTLSVESRKNEGSSFTIRLPLPARRKGESEEAICSFKRNREVPYLATAGMETYMTDLTILVAEDNELNRELVRALLHRKNLEADYAENGRIALDKLEENHYDLLLLDMHMPVLSGEEIIKKIRSDETLKDLYIIAITANAMKGDREKYIAMGCNEYIAKPLNKDEFYEKIENMYKHTDDSSTVVKGKKVVGEPDPGETIGEEDSATIKKIIEVLKDNSRIFNPEEIQTAGETLLTISGGTITSLGNELLEAVKSFDSEKVKTVFQKLENILQMERKG